MPDSWIYYQSQAKKKLWSGDGEKAHWELCTEQIITAWEKYLEWESSIWDVLEQSLDESKASAVLAIESWLAEL